MYISKINSFLAGYDNIEKNDFLDIIHNANIQEFRIEKIEKDFLLTLILIKFGEKYPDLIFKGGTCLNKIYFPYFRMSEDLDFVINTDAGQSSRKKLLKEYENNFIEDLKILGIHLKEERTKFDSYKLAMFTFEYESIIDKSLQTIKIDISLKHNLLLDCVPGEIQTIYKDKIFEENIFNKHYINCIDLKESTAEKLRAALTRSTPAIRDYFDIWYIKHYGNFDFTEQNFLEILFIKLKQSEFKYVDNYKLLEKQIITDLKPVLNTEFDFNFEEIYNFILTFKK